MLTREDQLVDLPPTDERLCKVHGRPIQPAEWRSGHRKTGCARCKNTQPGYRLRKHRYDVGRRAWKRNPLSQIKRLMNQRSTRIREAHKGLD